MKYAYYPGCSLEGSAAEYAHASEAVLEALGVELEEVDDWVCCGATAAHATSHLLSIALPAISCVAAEKQSLDILTCCAACHSRLKQTNQQVRDDPELRAKISGIIEEDYHGNVNVLHVTEVLAREVGLEAIEDRVRKPLKGLKVACYYGCLMSRMPESLRGDKSEYPMLLDDLMKAVGAEPLDWPYKTECCGAALTLARQKTVIRLCADILQMAKQNGADVLAVACPLCQANLDMYQAEAEKLLEERFSIPVLYFVQLMGLAMDLDPKRVCLGKLIVDPLPILAQKGFIEGAVHL
ncbi:MAG: CoB--CoM heterodisulfide reductase iron-sulfur subunit B family protein [Phycisphaerales bacterium]|nr:MAG: CoB--CoM heterodisulfide reductase iron-sulfur subunit B family protein [Phycisphaerales bacterium]